MQVIQGGSELLQMNTREIASEYRLSHWAGVLQERNASGLSIKEYCKASGFRENVYYYWQRKLREAACGALATRSEYEATDPAKSLVPSGWAVCEASDPTVEDKPVTIEIGGIRVFAETDTAPELLVKVCRALKSLC